MADTCGRTFDIGDPLPEEYHDLLTNNPLWLERTKNVCILSKENAIAYGIGNRFRWCARI